MYGISHIRSVSVGLDSQIWYLFIYITGYCMSGKYPKRWISGRSLALYPIVLLTSDICGLCFEIYELYNFYSGPPLLTTD